ncbi:hypothetical protein BofuT4_uP088420.1 [Botrytis cinerea T4]|uniref:Uncharacterized protein n=1 Tax=Botryotinia fuckeliana (strain T4) TaxID=999810 RepID=G2YG81_BOTF4|nr:hypothetical protein BofuT4_uP088420.1 [Botrytis cinerea T4]
MTANNSKSDIRYHTSNRNRKHKTKKLAGIKIDITHAPVTKR